MRAIQVKISIPNDATIVGIEEVIEHIAAYGKPTAALEQRLILGTYFPDGTNFLERALWFKEVWDGLNDVLEGAGFEPLLGSDWDGNGFDAADVQLRKVASSLDSVASLNRRPGPGLQMELRRQAQECRDLLPEGLKP